LIDRPDASEVSVRGLAFMVMWFCGIVSGALMPGSRLTAASFVIVRLQLGAVPILMSGSVSVSVSVSELELGRSEMSVAGRCSTFAMVPMPRNLVAVKPV